MLRIDHSLTGIWNERLPDLEYVKALRETLDQNGFQHTRIVAADKKWEIALILNENPSYLLYIDIIGCHYPGMYTTDAAMKLLVNDNRPLWSSEDFSTKNDNIGAGCLARILNRNLVLGNMTSTIAWNLISSYYEDLPWNRSGLMTADQPWSGHYEVSAPIWIAAHTTQFAQPGSTYLQHGSGVGMLDGGGSFVTIVPHTGSTDFTLVIETMTHDHSPCVRPPLANYSVSKQTATFQLGGSFLRANITQLNVFRSKLAFNADGSSDPAHTVLFDKWPKPLAVSNGQFSLQLDVDEVYTVTTLTSGTKGAPSDPVPPSAPFPLPYRDDFERYAPFAEPDNFAQQAGAFEVRLEDKRHDPLLAVEPEFHKVASAVHYNADKRRISAQPAVNHYLLQTVAKQPVCWCPLWDTRPHVVIGDHNWSDVNVSVRFRLPSKSAMGGPAAGVLVGARQYVGGCDAIASAGVFFWLSAVGANFTLTGSMLRWPVFEHGVLPMPVELDKWHALQLVVRDRSAAAFYDGHQLLSAPLAGGPLHGFVSFGTQDFGLAHFDDFAVSPA